MVKSTETLNEQMVWWRTDEMDTAVVCYPANRRYFSLHGTGAQLRKLLKHRYNLESLNCAPDLRNNALC